MAPSNQHSIQKHLDISLQHQVVEDSTYQNAALQQQALKISRAMQTTLDLYGLLRKFTAEIKSYVNLHSVHYKHPESQHEYLDGTVQMHKLQYNLKIEEEQLGRLIFSRDSVFNEDEISIIENAISQLMFPLKNSLAYHKALMSSLTCPLTGLGNRHAYDVAIAKEVEFCKRHEINLSLLILDLDKFKQINDTHGHLAGDKVLQETANRLMTECRDSDILFRYGGEEFAVILKNCDLDGAYKIANRLASALSATPVEFDNLKLMISTCIGIACLQPQQSSQDLFAQADRALYQAKNLGPNHIQSV